MKYFYVQTRWKDHVVKKRMVCGHKHRTESGAIRCKARWEKMQRLHGGPLHKTLEIIRRSEVEWKENIDPGAFGGRSL